jgi:hypothetical protein
MITGTASYSGVSVAINKLGLKILTTSKSQK